MRSMGGSLSFAEELGEAVFTAAMPLECGGAGAGASRPRAVPAGRRSFEDDAATFSRKAFEDMFNRMARSASRRGECFSLLLIEREDGAATDCALAASLAPLLSATQTAGRFGSGEVGALLPGAGPEEAGRIANAIRAGLARASATGSPAVYLGAAACIPETRPSLSDILETAKKALHASRRDVAGKPRVLNVHGPE